MLQAASKSRETPYNQRVPEQEVVWEVWQPALSQVNRDKAVKS